MYCVLLDKVTGGYYMPPDDVRFYAYSDMSRCVNKPVNTRLVETEYETEEELKTIMFSAGFLRGYIDDNPVLIRNNDLISFYRDNNDISYCQYLLTKKKIYLENIHPSKLFTLCKVVDNQAYFPSLRSENKISILAYTSAKRITRALYEKYPGYKLIKIGFDADLVINDSIEL